MISPIPLSITRLAPRVALGSSLTRTPYGQRVKPGKVVIHNTDNPDDLNEDEAAELIGETRAPDAFAREDAGRAMEWMLR